MLDSLTVPRRAYDFEDYVDILRRNARWIVGPTFLGLIISTVVAYSMQDTYFSSALIRVTPQQISPQLVTSVTTQDVADRINSMAQSIESRNTLSNLITTYGLFKKDLQKEPLEDVIEKMKSSIAINVVGGSNAGAKFLPSMQVGFAYSDPYTAQKVCADLVTRFMNLSSQDVSQGQMEAHEFLKDELQGAKRQMEEYEQKLSDFRAKNAGRLPEEMQMNMQEMNALEGRLGGLTEQSNRINEQRMMLENELHIYQDRLTALKSPQATAINQKVAGFNAQIADWENRIAAMRETYTEDYPDLQSAKDTLAFLKKQRDAAAKEKPTKVDTSVADENVARDRQTLKDTIDRIQTQLKANSMDAQLNRNDIAGANAALRTYQGRMQGVPAGDKEEADLERAAAMAQQHYMELSATAEKSNVSIDMERHKQGETLELLDSASLPVEPVAPKRNKTIPVGAIVGFLVGVALVAVREVKDTSLKNLKDARLYTQLSILGSIPLLENDVVVQRRKQVMWVGWATATLAGLAIMATSVAHYYMTKGH